MSIHANIPSKLPTKAELEPLVKTIPWLSDSQPFEFWDRFMDVVPPDRDDSTRCFLICLDCLRELSEKVTLLMIIFLFGCSRPNRAFC
jgi:hypothetical protein